MAAADAAYMRAYNGARATELELAADSAAGRDPSRIAACGPLCHSALAMARRIESEFAPLGTRVVNPVSLTVGAQAAYGRILQEVDALHAKQAMLASMCATVGRTCQDPLALVLANNTGLRDLREAFGGAEKVNRTVLVLWQVDAEILSAWQGNATVLTALLIGIVLLLPACELALVLFLRLALSPVPAAAVIADLRLEERLLDQELELGARIAAKHAFRGAVAEVAV